MSSLRDGKPFYDNLELLNLCFQEADQTKLLLRNAGFGVTGTGLLETAHEALAEIERLRGLVDDDEPTHHCLFTLGPFFNMTNAYMACQFCGKRERC